MLYETGAKTEEARNAFKYFSETWPTLGERQQSGILMRSGYCSRGVNNQPQDLADGLPTPARPETHPPHIDLNSGEPDKVLEQEQPLPQGGGSQAAAAIGEDKVLEQEQPLPPKEQQATDPQEGHFIAERLIVLDFVKFGAGILSIEQSLRIAWINNWSLTNKSLFSAFLYSIACTVIALGSQVTQRLISAKKEPGPKFLRGTIFFIFAASFGVSGVSFLPRLTDLMSRHDLNEQSILTSNINTIQNEELSKKFKQVEAKLDSDEIELQALKAKQFDYESEINALKKRLKPKTP